MSDETLLKPSDVAKRCQVNTKTVLRAIHAGRLRASRLGESGALRVRPEDMEAWIDATVVEPPAAFRSSTVAGRRSREHARPPRGHARDGPPRSLSRGASFAPAVLLLGRMLGERVDPWS